MFLQAVSVSLLCGCAYFKVVLNMWGNLVPWMVFLEEDL